MTIKASPPPPESIDIEDDGLEDASPACVLVFNASDPSGAGGLTADITTIASVGGHPIAVVTGAYARDTAQIFDHFSFDDEAVAEQARAVLEDLPVQAIKVGFVGSPENISTIAEITTDYDEVPVIAYMWLMLRLSMPQVKFVCLAKPLFEETIDRTWPCLQFLVTGPSHPH